MIRRAVLLARPTLRRGAWTVAQETNVQELLNTHPAVAEAVIVDGTAHVVPKWQQQWRTEDGETLPLISDESDVRTWLVEDCGVPEADALRVTFHGDADSDEFRARRNARVVHRDLVRDVFDALDADSDGEIMREEFGKLMELVPSVTIADFADYGQWVRQDGEWSLTYGEFKQLVVDKQLIVSEGDGEFTVHAGLVSRVAAVMFAAADADADGEISRDECVALLRSYTVSAEDAREAFDAYDANGDGLMDEAEFAKMLREIEIITEPKNGREGCLVM